MIGGTLAVVLVAAGSVGAIAVYQVSNDFAKNSVDINDGTEAPVPEIGAYEGGFNVLVIGSDAYKTRTTELNDVNILVHVSADQTSAVAVSIPRDLVVPFPPCYNPETGKTSYAMAGRPINEALFYGGLNCAVTVVEALTGLEINYAGMIGFDGVAAMATAVGGVDVCTLAEINDDHVKLYLKPGTHHLTGWQALSFLRSRHGVGDGSDLTRISSQQVFLSALLRKLKSNETLTNGGTLLSLAKAAAANMTLSKELTQPATIIAMAKALNNIPMDRITFVQYPGSTGGEGIYEGKVQPKTALAEQIFSAIKADKPIGLDEAGDDRGSRPDPNATPDPEPTSDATPSPDAKPDADEKPSDDPSEAAAPSAPPASQAPLPEKVVISGVRGQTAADQTCTVGFLG